MARFARAKEGFLRGFLKLENGLPSHDPFSRLFRLLDPQSFVAKTTTETACYSLSTALSVERFNDVVRPHWGVENRPHWRLDVVMNEARARTRLDNGPHNMAVLRHMAINIMQKNGDKDALRGKFQKAARDNACLARLLALF